MRILLANEGAYDAGGVSTYLRALVAALRARGHSLAFLHYNPAPAASTPLVEPAFGVRELGVHAALDAVARWAPDVCYSHNMQPLDVDRALLQRWPVVKMMHGYVGTCISGQKAHAWPSRVVCNKPFGAACLAHFLPRRCGEAAPLKMWRRYDWTRQQRAQFSGYAALVVASAHMRREYLAAGVPGSRVHAIPLFAPDRIERAPVAPATDRVVFLGRMTALKGGDILVQAVAGASRLLGRPVALTMAGDGPARLAWAKQAARARVVTEFPGWLEPPALVRLLSTASVIAVPSTWPEPFGLVGLEAAACGVPAVAFDVGGIREWLHDDVNGLLAGTQIDARPVGEALARILRDRALRERLAAGALRVAGEMTVGRHVDALLERVLEPAAGAQTSK
jgi:glycosyltransferase involved in cell wall biosynthesis